MTLGILFPRVRFFCIGVRQRTDHHNAGCSFLTCNLVGNYRRSLLMWASRSRLSASILGANSSKGQSLTSLSFSSHISCSERIFSAPSSMACLIVISPSAHSDSSISSHSRSPYATRNVALVTRHKQEWRYYLKLHLPPVTRIVSASSSMVCLIVISPSAHSNKSIFSHNHSPRAPQHMKQDISKRSAKQRQRRTSPFESHTFSLVIARSRGSSATEM